MSPTTFSIGVVPLLFILSWACVAATVASARSALRGEVGMACSYALVAALHAALVASFVLAVAGDGIHLRRAIS